MYGLWKSFFKKFRRGRQADNTPYNRGVAAIMNFLDFILRFAKKDSSR